MVLQMYSQIQILIAMKILQIQENFGLKVLNNNGIENPFITTTSLKDLTNNNKPSYPTDILNNNRKFVGLVNGMIFYIDI